MADLKIIKMSDIQPEPVEWLWEPYIPSGTISLIQGDGGEGKTSLSLAIAAAITNGNPLPGCGVNAAPANVIVQNAEDSYTKTIRPRLEQFGADCDMIHVIDEDGQALSLSDERIEQAIIKTNAHLLILDPVQAYFGGANMNSANDVRPLMKRLGDVAKRTDCAVILVGHLHKKCGKAAYRGLGSIDIYAAARSVMTVGRIPVDENVRVIVHNKSNLAPAAASLAFQFDPVCGFTWQGEYDINIDELFNGRSRQPESQFAKARRLIETALANGSVPAADMMQMAEEQGISLKTLNLAKDALGVISIKRRERWYWELPIDAEFTEVSQDGQHGQDSHTDDRHDCHENTVANLTTLTILHNGEVA